MPKVAEHPGDSPIARVTVQPFGGFLAAMVLPNIAAFVAGGCWPVIRDGDFIVG